MAVNTTPIFIDSVASGECTVASGAVNTATLLTAGADGSRVDSVSVVASTTTTAGRFQLVVNDGTTDYVIHDEAVDALTVSTSQAPFQATVPLGINLPNGYTLKAQLASGAVAVGATLHFVAQGGNY